MSLNVLLVDDSRIVRAVLEKTLKLTDVNIGQCIHAENGQEGLDALSMSRFDVIFADINMPVMNGVEMIENIRANPQTADIPVVVISTEGSTTRIEHLQTLGITDYLRKPFQPEDFRAIVESIAGATS